MFTVRCNGLTSVFYFGIWFNKDRWLGHLLNSLLTRSQAMTPKQALFIGLTAATGTQGAINGTDHIKRSMLEGFCGSTVIDMTKAPDPTFRHLTRPAWLGAERLQRPSEFGEIDIGDANHDTNISVAACKELQNDRINAERQASRRYAKGGWRPVPKFSPVLVVKPTP
jgi:hypothetical protein